MIAPDDQVLDAGDGTAGLRGELGQRAHVAGRRHRDAVDVPVIAAGGFADGRGLAASIAYGAAGIPKYVLVGPDGRILASDGDLRGVKLEKTLETFLK